MGKCETQDLVTVGCPSQIVEYLLMHIGQLIIGIRL